MQLVFQEHAGNEDGIDASPDVIEGILREERNELQQGEKHKKRQTEQQVEGAAPFERVQRSPVPVNQRYRCGEQIHESKEHATGGHMGNIVHVQPVADIVGAGQENPGGTDNRHGRATA
jgi:hypothetical protein